ncbi:MAG: hypothetical protein BGO34_17995 [Bacteroidia bacterium 44-10]|nr:MAG: hypothetical protein BGO34_17995 [Bacteroidia bacterium 44-10]
MAVKTYMKPTLAIVAREIAAFMNERGLEREEFSLVGSWQERTGRISLLLGTTRNVDWFDWYQNIIGRLRSSFAEVGTPEAAWNIGLVVLTRTQDELYSSFRLTDGEEDVTDFLESTIGHTWDQLKASPTATAAPG